MRELRTCRIAQLDQPDFAGRENHELTSSPLFSSSLTFLSPFKIVCISRCLRAACAAVSPAIVGTTCFALPFAVLLEVPGIPVWLPGGAAVTLRRGSGPAERRSASLLISSDARECGRGTHPSCWRLLSGPKMWISLYEGSGEHCALPRERRDAHVELVGVAPEVPFNHDALDANKPSVEKRCEVSCDAASDVANLCSASLESSNRVAGQARGVSDARSQMRAMRTDRKRCWALERA